jgi:predicted transcriptional regulator
MESHSMKTTIDLSDDLAKQAKAYAARNHTTLRAVIEQGIRQVLSNDRSASKFKLRDVSVVGNGLREEYKDADWSRIREVAYKGRGG